MLRPGQVWLRDLKRGVTATDRKSMKCTNNGHVFFCVCECSFLLEQDKLDQKVVSSEKEHENLVITEPQYI